MPSRESTIASQDTALAQSTAASNIARQAAFLQPPPAGFVTIYAQDGSGSVTCLLGNAPAQLTGGIGGWTTEDRAGLPPAVMWTAPEAIRYAVPLLFDSRGRSIESQITALRRLGRPGGQRVAPQVLGIKGGAVEGTALDWVMESLEPTDEVIRQQDANGGDRTRQGYTMTLLHYTPPVEVHERSAAKKNRDRHKPRHGSGKKGGRTGPHTWVVQNGDTLRSIAAKVYHDAGKWKAIATANKIRDGRHLKVGRHLRLP